MPACPASLLRRFVLTLTLTLTLGRGLALALLAGGLACDQSPPPPPPPPTPSAAADLTAYCQKQHGSPRVERVSEHVWAALGYDLSNVILISTPAGKVIVDTGASLTRAARIRQDLEAQAPPGPVLAVIFTHSHADHIAGASVWAGPDTPIWATSRFIPDLLKQYSLFMPAEKTRGRRQFGLHVPPAAVPCSALGQRLEPGALRGSGALLPNHTFHDHQKLTFGGLEVELLAAPGETEDTLAVWVPADRTLIPGDDFYNAFPNLYTLRGTSPRPVDGWIKSLDAMRALAPEHLAPTHTNPRHGREDITQALTNYRDAIQWVRDEVVRRANQGQDLDTIAHEARLPARLAGLPYLQPTYGQVDWSVRAIYTNYLGWFDGRPEALYPLGPRETAAREVRLMGGPVRVLKLGRQALAEKDPRWALHLLAKLRRSGEAQGGLAPQLNAALAEACQAVAYTTANTNGRAYLLEMAWEYAGGAPENTRTKPRAELIAHIPLDYILQMLTRQLNPAKAAGVHESMGLEFPDEHQHYTLTVRYGLAQVTPGGPLPGDPPPLAILTLNAADLRGLVTGEEGLAGLVAGGHIGLQGSLTDTLRFWFRFERPGSDG
ncbi:MAG: MBL fold metallo-hydrolase [Deltaproteobacteria bacterium]|nr:MBL fold metallo-hydrolase [Deltaproteobacteria bacterium]